MKRIEDQEEEDAQLAMRAVSYIFCARRPLSVTELCHALAVEAEDTMLDATALPETEILLNISAGLIKVDDESGTAGLIHSTLQEYLEKYREKLLPNPELEIANACLIYLSLDIFGEGPCSSATGLQRRLQEHQFFDYASHNWGHHIRENQLHESVVGLLFTFLQDERKLSSFVQALHVPPNRKTGWHDHFPKQFGALHVVAYWGLDEILMTLSENDMNVDSQDSYGTTALELAAKHGHTSVVQLLLRKGASVNTRNGNGETALYWAARNGHRTILELLLANKGDALTKDNEEWTALDWAAVQGDNVIMKTLLDDGADVVTEHDGTLHALFLAADEGHELTVQMLLDSGVNVNAQDWEGSTALDWAVPAGHEKTVQVLLRNGADLKSKDIFGNTAMHWAVPHEKLARLLLEYGIDIDTKNDAGQTALCWAAQDGPVAVVKLLLETKADVNAQDKYGFTALH